MNILPKDILGSPPVGAIDLKEFVLAGAVRRSNRGKLSQAAQVQKAINLLMDDPVSTDRDLIHDRMHIENDVEGAPLQTIGAYREFVLPDNPLVLIRESQVRLFPLVGEVKRSNQDLIRMVAGPGDGMSRIDIESLAHLEKLAKT
jgi:hypothetical protein